jgi:hypothetical protein
MTSYNALSQHAVTEPKRKHDQYSHLASCFENYCLYYRYRHIDPLDTRGLHANAKLPNPLGHRPGPGRPPMPTRFGLNRTIGLPNPNRGLPSRVAPGGWR